MQQIILSIILSLILLLSTASQTKASSPAIIPFASESSQLSALSIKESYYTGKVLEVLETTTSNTSEISTITQKLKVQILSGPEKGSEILIDHGTSLSVTQDNALTQNQKVLLLKSESEKGSRYMIADKYRLPAIFQILAIFIFAAVIFAKRKGISSLLGLSVTILILIKGIIPALLAGFNPLLIIFIGCLAISSLSLFIAHGFSKETLISFVATITTFLIACFAAVIFTSLASLSGQGSEETIYLMFGPGKVINLQGLLLGGILLGVLGVLDDVTTSQTEAVHQLHQTDKNMTQKELYSRASKIGTEHIASLINTLALAYAGASLPILLLFTLNQNLPLWVVLNSEQISEEIIRTLVGSLALILAVPISTYIASWTYAKR